MMASSNLFSNENISGFEIKGYSSNAIQPTEINWNRVNAYQFPENPKLIKKITMDNRFINVVPLGSFVINEERHILLSDCSNSFCAPHDGRIIEISSEGKIKEIFKTRKRLTSPVIGNDNCIYISTVTVEEKSNDTLFCLNIDGSIRWLFELEGTNSRVPVIDGENNVYLITWMNQKAKLISINKNGEKNWSREFNSDLWFEPIITKTQFILLGLNRTEELLLLDKGGNINLCKRIGDGFGSFSFRITHENKIYATLSNRLYVLDFEGAILGDINVDDRSVVFAPVFDNDSNMYIINNNSEIISCDRTGKERWRNVFKGIPLRPPIIDVENNVLTQSYFTDHKKVFSWIQLFSNDGFLKWAIEIDGTLVTSLLAGKSLLYSLTNIYKGKGKWSNERDAKWELNMYSD